MFFDEINKISETANVGDTFKFKCVPVREIYYNSDSTWGVFCVTTSDKIPYIKPYKDMSDNEASRGMTQIVGKMQQLYDGSEYNVTAELTYNSKYKSYQYQVVTVSSTIPKSSEAQRTFLKTFISERVADNLLDIYPNIVEDVTNGVVDTIDFKKVSGVGAATWNRIKTTILDNYVVSDIIVMLQPLNVTYAMIKKLLDGFGGNAALCKQKLEENPYIVTSIHGIGFKKADDLALKIKPEMRCSAQRLTAFVVYYLKHTGEQDGHTWITRNELGNRVTDNVPECSSLYEDLMNQEISWLYKEEDKVGLRHYYNIEKSIFDIIIEKNNTPIDKFDFTDEEIELAIKQAEEEQGFVYNPDQRSKIEQGLKQNVTFISGKAGTGKTSILRAFIKAYRNRNMSISAMALSAKAAQRITEATGLAATTIHRGLGCMGLTKFNYNHDNPLPVDVVFIDEASMINTQLFFDMLCAVGRSTRLLLSGDYKQLAPIGYGNTYTDILGRKDLFHALELTQVMRQAEKSGILSDANKIRDGINPVESPDAKLVHGELQDLCYMFRNNRETIQQIAIRQFMKFKEVYGLDETVIITPRRKDCPNSTMEINKIIQEQLVGNNPYVESGFMKFHEGAKVLQTVNDYDKNVFNGEIGYIIEIKTNYNEKGKPVKTVVCKFPNLTARNDESKFKLVDYKENELNMLDLAYAITCHKSQGSTYDCVIGIVDNTHYKMLNTSLLYTMITRARKRHLQLAEPQAFMKCIHTDGAGRDTWTPLFETE